MDAADVAFLSLDELTLSRIGKAIDEDAEYRAMAVNVGLCFGIRSTESGTGMVFVLDRGATNVFFEPPSSMKPQFVLNAGTHHWQQFFAAVPKRPFQSYWGMLRVLGQPSGVEVCGDVSAFTAHAPVWRLVLDRVRAAISLLSPSTSQTGYLADDELDDDSIIGHYTWITLPQLGKCKVFYETSGHGGQPVLFLHTAGADSRQFHSLMQNKQLQTKCTMYAFDLPGHGRSFPGTQQYPLSYSHSEEIYVSAIGQMISKLRLSRVIVSGASMGGQVCLAVALRAQELDIRGVIPCEGCDYLPKQQAQTIYSLVGDEAILNPERVCGMMSPTSPAMYKRLNWWIYSSQASQIFPGDLKFYFEGWDGRDRMGKIDTKRCPVYMLTGEYDYSCTPDMSRATAAKINGAVFEEMKGLGHFPMSEDPKRFLPYFIRALEHISQEAR
ncbi:uncharacterized protein Z518_07884 [Rhinocladiella mackenziei CBS 650.93]|uniref:Rhinocladiella mackenziei CBS 650.93 unplaced genomic scaffold supercont1.6, whole genome shotgun sequence n=1 Tax=Rhinocladiella mackenziei CBS 650.93 TaxID=1442369 RepID=A0A0D2IZ96_9EURO|nr:uncharacterized protein Z518_07884 [Rhinocladiella mackenziei CBS 650.93]KIX01945.1 hypothetical protein Z518_07884 [Rhinocladiella mackenziei CBS 650.93]